MSPTTVTLVTIFAGLLIAFGGWVVAVIVRREQTRVELQAKSGTIRTSEAKDLWDEADKIRDYLSARLTERDAEIGRLGDKVGECLKAVAEAHATAEACQRAAEQAKRETAECREREAALEERIAACERHPHQP